MVNNSVSLTFLTDFLKEVLKVKDVKHVLQNLNVLKEKI